MKYRKGIQLIRKHLLMTIASKLFYKFQFNKEAVIGYIKRDRNSMATLPLGHFIPPLTKELSRQDRNTVNIEEMS